MIVSRTSRWPQQQMLLAVVDALLTATAIHVAVFFRLGTGAGYEYWE
jgi:hypothetical protein